MSSKITCPFCRKQFNVFLRVDTDFPEAPTYKKVAMVIIGELERRKTPCLTFKVLARRCGYKSSAHSDFKKALKWLVEEERIQFHRSGYRSEPVKYHAKVVCLKKEVS